MSSELVTAGQQAHKETRIAMARSHVVDSSVANAPCNLLIQQSALARQSVRQEEVDEWRKRFNYRSAFLWNTPETDERPAPKLDAEATSGAKMIEFGLAK